MCSSDLKRVGQWNVTCDTILVDVSEVFILETDWVDPVRFSGEASTMRSEGLRKFHCHLRSISSMATMNALTSNCGPLWGR